jgi:hypothetical protein
MRHDAASYDDDDALTDYVWRNCQHLMSDEELAAYKALIGAAKIDAYTEDGVPPANAGWYHKHFGTLDDPIVERQLRDGRDAFYRGVRDRLIRERSDDVFVNRCGRCNRIVASPLARQCLWCGHDWHEIPLQVQLPDTTTKTQARKKPEGKQKRWWQFWRPRSAEIT